MADIDDQPRLEVVMQLNEKLDVFLERARESQRTTNQQVVLKIPPLCAPYSGVHIPDFSFYDLYDVRTYIRDRSQETVKAFPHIFACEADAYEAMTVPFDDAMTKEKLELAIQDQMELADYMILTQFYGGRSDFSLIDTLIKHDALKNAIEHVRVLRLKKQQLFKNPPIDLGSVKVASQVFTWLLNVFNVIYEHHWQDAIEFSLPAVEGPIKNSHFLSRLFWVKRPDGSRFPPAGLFLSEDKSGLRVTGLDLQITQSFQRNEFVPALETFFAKNPSFVIPDDNDAFHERLRFFEMNIAGKKTLNLQELCDANIFMMAIEMYGRRNGQEDVWCFLRAIRDAVWDRVPPLNPASNLGFKRLTPIS